MKWCSAGVFFGKGMGVDSMKAIEFEADIQDGIVKIPESYAAYKDTHARIVILINEAEASGVAAPDEGQLDFSKFKVNAFDHIDGLEFQREVRHDW